ncbi:MAG: hypothetical protein HC896_03635 [Bacteroidales bacterium]|nr:hypothetical protein [Bacteroidales bacterium]
MATFLYAHVMEQSVGQICLPGFRGKIKSATLLPDGSEIQVSTFWNGERFYIKEDDIFINFGLPTQHTFRLPDKIDSVIKLELNQ